MVKKIFIGALILMSSLQSERISPEEALERLMIGNKHYVEDQLEHPNRTSIRREAVVSVQKPFATILGCSDSRVSPEIIFDQGVGDLFVVRVAGNVVGVTELDSIDFAALYLGTSVILVMGHQNCGAVEAVLGNNTRDIKSIAKLIVPAVKKAKKMSGNLLEDAVKANILHSVDVLKKSKLIKRLIKEKKISVVGGYYHLESGQVELLH